MGSVEVSCRFVEEDGKVGDLLSNLVEAVNNGVLVLNLVEDTVMRVMGPDVVDVKVVDCVTVGEVLLSSVSVATLSRVAKVEYAEANVTGVVNVFLYVGVDLFDNDDDMKSVDDVLELVEEPSDTFVLSLGPRLVLENNCDEDDTLLVDECLLVYAVDVSEDVELIFPDGYD